MNALAFYFPRGRTATTLREALAFGESFIVANRDHTIVSFVDWAELDADDRAPLLAIAELPEDEQVAALEDEWESDLDDDQRAATLRDDRQTLLAWMVEP